MIDINGKMKEYILDLFKYNDWANQNVLICLQKNKVDNEKILTLFYHIIAAQNEWLKRITHHPNGKIELWKSENLYTLIDMTNESSHRWIEFIQEYPYSNFEEVIAYINTKGTSFESKLSDILIHVTNHGTHHRGQILTHLRNLDIAPPILDYIYFCRK